jgi:hypothetical protein
MLWAFFFPLIMIVKFKKFKKKIHWKFKKMMKLECEVEYWKTSGWAWKIDDRLETIVLYRANQPVVNNEEVDQERQRLTNAINESHDSDGIEMIQTSKDIQEDKLIDLDTSPAPKIEQQVGQVIELVETPHVNVPNVQAPRLQYQNLYVVSNEGDLLGLPQQGNAQPVAFELQQQNK